MECLTFKFVVKAGERKVVSCEVPKAFRLTHYHIERENSTAHNIWFDGLRMVHLNAQRMSLQLNEPHILKNDFSFVSSNESNVFPETVFVKLYGTFL
jgi:hypothetical protein